MRFLCDDAECWITPADMVERRRAKRPELRVDPTLLYAPLDFPEDGSNWAADALAPARATPIPGISLKTICTSVSLVGAQLTTIVGPIGAPSTVGALEPAIALGARTILFFGICGSLQPDLGIGDLVLVEEAIREEGTSHHYLPPDVPARASARLLELAQTALDRSGEPHRAGTIWSTDAPYRETRTKVRRLAGEGVLAVEMEVSAVYALAHYRGVDALAIQIVSDQLIGDTWTGIDRESFRARCGHAVRILAEIAVAAAS